MNDTTGSVLRFHAKVLGIAVAVMLMASDVDRQRHGMGHCDCSDRGRFCDGGRSLARIARCYSFRPKSGAVELGRALRPNSLSSPTSASTRVAPPKVARSAPVPGGMPPCGPPRKRTCATQKYSPVPPDDLGMSATIGCFTPKSGHPLIPYCCRDLCIEPTIWGGRDGRANWWIPSWSSS